MSKFIPHRIINTIEEIQELESLISFNPIAYDSETAGLYGSIELIQLYQAEWDECILIQQPTEVMIMVLIGFLNNASEVVMHNASYDISCVHATGIKWLPDHVEDTLLLSRLVWPKMQKFSLDMCYVYGLKFNPYRDNDLTKQELQKEDWSGELRDDQVLYACTDVYYLLDLYNTIKHKRTSNSYKVDIDMLKDCLSWQGNGMPVCQTEINNTIEQLQTDIDAIDLPDHLNINSWQQVRRFLDSEESDKLYLKTEALKGNVKAGNITKKRTLVKRLSFVNKYDSFGGRVPGIFAPLARSGRLTCKHENLQQWPRELKHLVKAPPGRILVYSDFDSLEMRCIAALIGDPILLKILREGLGPHDYVAERMFGPNYTQEQRRVAKTENFLLLYGGGVAMLQSMLILQADLFASFEQASEYKKEWLKVFEVINEWHEQGFDDHRHKITWKTPLGREYLGNLGTDHLNIQIQGMGAEVAKLGRLYARKQLIEQGLDSEVLMCCLKHDDYLYEMDDDPAIYEPVCRIVGDAMLKAWKAVTGMKVVKYDVAMPVEVDAGYQLSTIDKKGSKYKYTLTGE